MSENSSPRSSSSQSYDSDGSIYGDDVTSILRASIHKTMEPLQRECSKEISKKLEWEFENDIFKMYFKKFPLALTELCRVMQISDDNLYILKNLTHKLMDQGFNIIMESEMCQEYFKQVEEFVEQKSIFNQRLKQQRETGEQEFEKIKAFYYELQSDSSSQSEALKHLSKKLVNINQRFSACEEALRESDSLLEKVQESLGEKTVEDLDNVERYEEISDALKRVKQAITAWVEKIERLDFENNIMKTDLASLEKSSPTPSSKKSALKKSPEDQAMSSAIKIAEPVMLSTHLYIEALEQKVREVNELRRAFVELAVHATDERIKGELDFKCNDKGKNTYQNQYIAEGLKKAKARLDKIQQKDKDDEFKLVLKAEKAKFDELFGRYKKEVMERRFIHNKLEDLKGNVRVYCRVRGLIKDEKNAVPHQNEPYVSFPDAHSVRICNIPQKRDITFELNHVFTNADNQTHIFDEVSPLISSVLDGYNACIMAYGQTGSGKTYTMVGSDEDPGVIPRAVSKIFEKIQEREADYEYQVCLSILEIYNEQVRDLLASNTSAKIDIREFNGTINLMPCLIAPSIQNQSQAFQIIHKGEANRTTGSTLCNEFSSRSHLIVKFTVLSTNKVTGKSYTSSLNLVDLAGSERLYKSESEGERLKETCHINQSLVTLGKVLNSLALKQPHVPYRESKLTHLLKESLGGDSKTLLIIQVSPDPKELSESLSTLQFGTHVMKVEKNKPKSCILQEVDPNTSSSVAKSMVLSSSPTANDNSKMKVSKSTNALNGSLQKLESPSPKIEHSSIVSAKESSHKEKDKENGSTQKTPSQQQQPPKAIKVAPFLKPTSNASNNVPPKKGRSATLSDTNQLVHVIDVARFRRDSGHDNKQSKVNVSLTNLK